MLPPHKTRGQQHMFYYFRLEEHIPKDCTRRKLDCLIHLEPIWKRLAEFYVPAFGRPAIDPEVVFGILLLGYPFGPGEIIGELLEITVDQRIAHSLMKTHYLRVDGTQVEAKASISRLEPVEVEETAGEYSKRMELTQTEQTESPSEDRSQNTESAPAQDGGFQGKAHPDVAELPE